MAQELNIRLSADEGTPLYRQIYTYIRDEIRRGSLEADERLPSTRSLAAGLHVARSTAELAYSQLLSEGYIRAKKNSGYYVNEIENLQDLHFGGADTDAEEEETGEKKSGQEKGHRSVYPAALTRLGKYVPAGLTVGKHLGVGVHHDLAHDTFPGAVGEGGHLRVPQGKIDHIRA